MEVVLDLSGNISISHMPVSWFLDHISIMVLFLVFIESSCVSMMLHPSLYNLPNNAMLFFILVGNVIVLFTFLIEVGVVILYVLI